MNATSWQPIETAPMGDGVYIPSGPILICGNRFHDSNPAGYWVQIVDSHNGKYYGNFDGDEWFDSPTHWMPLSEPPIVK